MRQCGLCVLGGSKENKLVTRQRVSSVFSFRCNFRKFHLCYTGGGDLNSTRRGLSSAASKIEVRPKSRKLDCWHEAMWIVCFGWFKKGQQAPEVRLELTTYR